jgi:hypothetical protein
MTRAEQEAFEKWIVSKGLNLDGFIEYWGSDKYLLFKSVFLAGYRAGFEAQHYEVDDA